MLVNRVDNAGARGIMQKDGAGRLRRIDLALLWFQNEVRQKNVLSKSIGTHDCPADLGTKNHGSKRVAFLLGMMGYIDNNTNEPVGKFEIEEYILKSSAKRTSERFRTVLRILLASTLCQRAKSMPLCGTNELHKIPYVHYAALFVVIVGAFLMMLYVMAHVVKVVEGLEGIFNGLCMREARSWPNHPSKEGWMKVLVVILAIQSTSGMKYSMTVEVKQNGTVVATSSTLTGDGEQGHGHLTAVLSMQGANPQGQEDQMSVSECGTGFQGEQSALPEKSSATAAIQPERGGGSQLPHAPMANVCRIGSGVCYHRPTCGMVLRTARCESHKLKRLSLEDARKCGLKPCKQCGPD